MNQKLDVIILSVPYCEPFPMVAPVLLAGCLESAGIRARGLDFNAEFIKEFGNKPYYTQFKNFLTIGHLFRPEFGNVTVYRDILKWTKNFLGKLIKEHDPRYIGLSVFTSESLDFSMVLSYLLRRYWPKVKIIAGGKGLEVTGATGQKHYDTWIDNSIADVIIVGDAESAIIDTISKNLTGIIHAKAQTKHDLDNIPLAKWDDYDLTLYGKLSDKIDKQNVETDPHVEIEPYLAVTASKGCVRQCTFCDVANFWPDFIYRDPLRVADEIIFNYRKTGIKKFLFTDNLINGSIKNFRIMNEVLAREIPRTITYSGYAIFRGRGEMPERDFALAAEAGNNRWSVGVESGSEKVRYDMKKKFDNQDLDWSVQMLYKYKIQQNWLLIVGYPSETEKDFQDTKDMFYRYAHLNHDHMITLQITPTFMLLNNSPLLNNHDLAVEYGLDHLHVADPMMQRFWTSSRYLDNDFSTRSRRWKELVSLAQELGYGFGPGMPVQKWRDEIENLDKIYAEQKIKIIPIYTAQ